MRKLLFFILLCAPFTHAATWYATSSSVNIDTASLWVPTSTGSCTGSGTALTWGSQANGDTFNANGCTALAIDVDPGGVSVQVTLTNDSTNGGAFTYATATNITIHANITTTKVACLAITGSTGGGTISGNVTGSSTTTGGIKAVNDTHTSVTITVIGNITGGSAAGAIGYYSNAASGHLAVTGNVLGGSGNASVGLQDANSATITITGNCSGSDTVETFGCEGEGAGAITLVGNNINGKRGNGAVGNIIFTPAATNYILSAKDSSYVLGTVNSHATEMPTDPGVGNVSSGVNYGTFTGTLTGGSQICSAQTGWR